MASTTYPRTRADLAKFHEAQLTGRGRDARYDAQYAHGYTDEAVAALLGCDVETVQALKAGLFDTLVSVDGAQMPFPEVMLPAKALALKVDYARFLGMCESTPPRDVPEPDHDVIAQSKASDSGSVNPDVVAWLKTNLRGEQMTYAAKRANPVRKTQVLNEYDVNFATLAAVVGNGATAEDVLRWTTGQEPVPVSNAGTEYERVLTFLLSGPMRGNPGPKTKNERNGAMY